MEWKGKRQSDNFEDRRGRSSSGKIALGGIGGIVILLIGFLLGGDPQQLLQQLQQVGVQTAPQEPAEISAEEQELTEMTRVVFASTEEVWQKVFSEHGLTYEPDTLVVYWDGTETGGCGYGDKAYGPFYCPADRKIYIDLRFNQELQRFGATGDFAMAYVIAHEMGHHVQNLLGTMDRVNSMRQQLSESEYNKLSVQLELQADFYAGLWAHHANKSSDVRIDAADIDDGLRAAAAVGDDHLQMQAQGRVVPDAFTHGTSEQRAHWFKKGYETGDMRQGDTFGN